MNILKQRIMKLFGDGAIKHNDEYVINSFGNDIRTIQKKLEKIYDEADNYTQEPWLNRNKAIKDLDKTKKDMEQVAKSLTNIAQKWYKECLSSYDKNK